ncbi:putative oxidoreductase [Polaromonas sp. YR568]|uniref:DoxX family protein n=1 Tax=Polaromonas sp. YR568 TaxID=1855301 RepID=UPI0008EF692C|nr:DoxX family protein [Polaromonas sp. YR568]SFU70495.1 putative oxidoreductase [Polaromonas sp. YR568]
MQPVVILSLARILMALAFIGPGASHFIESARLRNYTAAAIGAIEVSAGLALAFGWQVRWFALAAAAFLLVDAFIAHGFWAATPQELRNQVLHFFKNLALAGGFVLLALAPQGR